MTMYTQMGTSCPLKERLMLPFCTMTWQMIKAITTML